MDRTEEKELIQLLKTGQKQALMDLCQAYHDLCYRLVYLRVHNQKVAQKLTELAFIDVWFRRFFLKRNQSFFSFLVNRVPKYLPSARRKNHRLGDGDFLDVGEAGPDPVSLGFTPFLPLISRMFSKPRELVSIEDPYQRIIAQTIRDKFSKKQRWVYGLHVLEAYTFEEIAFLLNISEYGVFKLQEKNISSLARHGAICLPPGGWHPTAINAEGGS